jgi:hypothetical protein
MLYDKMIIIAKTVAKPECLNIKLILEFFFVCEDNLSMVSSDIDIFKLYVGGF